MLVSVHICAPDHTGGISGSPAQAGPGLSVGELY